VPHSYASDAIKGVYTGGDTAMEWVRQTPTIRNPVLRGQGHFYLGYKCQYRCRANSAEEFSQPSTLWRAVLSTKNCQKKFNLHQPAFRSLATTGKSYDSAICFA